MHHTNTGLNGSARRLKDDAPAMYKDFPLIRLVQPRQYIHQRRFARAIFAQQGMNGAWHGRKGNAIIGDNPGKAFGNPP